MAVRAAQAEAAQLLAATAEQQEIALKGIRGQLTHEGERRVKLEEDFALQLETVRTEADTKHQAKVAELEVEAAERLDATRRDAETALEILATELKAQAAKQTQSAVDEAARAADVRLSSTRPPLEISKQKRSGRPRRPCARADRGGRA